jgi:hypothetical protein
MTRHETYLYREGGRPTVSASHFAVKIKADQLSELSYVSLKNVQFHPARLLTAFSIKAAHMTKSDSIRASVFLPVCFGGRSSIDLQ